MTALTDKLPDFALLARELERCGWNAADTPFLSACPDLVFQTSQGRLRAPVRLFRADGDAPLLLLDFGDLEIGGQKQLFPRFLDFSLETRLALEATRLLAPGGWLLLVSGAHMDLFRLPNETLEFHVTSVREFEDELLPALAARAGSRRARGLASLPNLMDEARELRDWLTHWSRQLANPLEENPADCEKFIWKLILMLQTARKVGAPAATSPADQNGAHNADPADSPASPGDAPPDSADPACSPLAGWGVRCECRAGEWTFAYDSLSTHDDLAALLEDFDQTFSTRIFSGDADLHREWLARLEEGSLAEQLRAELLMQSQLKFEAESVAWLFTDVDREQEGWRREVNGLPPVRRRLSAEGWQVVSPLPCDVATAGLGAALRDLDRLAEHWADFDLFVRRRREAGEADPGFSQPDLFVGKPRGVGPDGRLNDGVNFVLSESLRVAVPETEEFGVGVTILLKALTWPRRFDWPFFGIDTLDRVWQTD